jgi:hypothetical protein
MGPILVDRRSDSNSLPADAGQPVSVTTGEIASAIDHEVIAARAEATM